MLQGASNAWFAITLSALAIRGASDELLLLVDDHWAILEKVQSGQNIELLQQVTPQLRDLAERSSLPSGCVSCITGRMRKEVLTVR